MSIVGYKSGGHDGSVCSIVDGKLVFSIEGEKDTGPRHSLVNQSDFEAIIHKNNVEPTVICGDSSAFSLADCDNYSGISLNDIYSSKATFGGKNYDYLSVPHELSHIIGSLALSDIPVGQHCYVLVWEGYLGCLYYVNDKMEVSRVGDGSPMLDYPGLRYALPYHATGRCELFGHEAAGKIMALAGLEGSQNCDGSKEQEIAELIVNAEISYKMGRVALNRSWTNLYDKLEYLRYVPASDERMVRLCRSVQDQLYSRCLSYLKANVTSKLPLVITGGCGLNCEWNTQLRESGLFESVFVPPVPNDTGIAIGAAATAQLIQTGQQRLEWDVYCGEEFREQQGDLEQFGYKKLPLDFSRLCELIYDKEEVVVWVQGRYEMGPRALCNRSLIASPLSEKVRDRLNQIKQREFFRPVAPVCLEEDVSEHFEWSGPSPYMLYFQQVKSKQLKAVTHFDCTARVQTVNASQNPIMHQLLQECKKYSGYGVLCNTSFNFRGAGFINNTHHVMNFAHETGVNAFVIGDWMYIKNSIV